MLIREACTKAICYYMVTLFAWMTKTMQAKMEELGFLIIKKGSPLSLYNLCNPYTSATRYAHHESMHCLYTLPSISALLHTALASCQQYYTPCHPKVGNAAHAVGINSTRI